MPRMIRINPDSKRTKSAILFFTYGVMTVSTILISAIALFFVLGYRIDDKSLTVEQGGLLQFVSAPAGANVFVDGKQQNFKTPNKLTVEAGSRKVDMKLNGYQNWSKTISVGAGEIMWLNYTRFIPNEVKTQVLRQFDTLYASLASPNKRYMALQPSANEPKLVIANIRNENQVTFSEVEIPASAYTQNQAEPDKFEIVEWNLDGRYLLIRRTTANVEEFLRFDRQNPAETINLTAKFGPIKRAQFAGNNGNVVYAIINGELRLIPVAAEQTELLASGVNYFIVYRGDQVGYIAERDQQQEVGIIKNNRDTVVSEYPLGTPLAIALSNYFNKDYLAISTGKKVDIIQEPADARTAVGKVYASLPIDQPGTEWLFFSNNGRFLVSQYQAQVTTYDLELRQVYKRAFSSPVPVTRQFKWLDDYYLWVDLENNLRIVEFDGSNERAITAVSTNQSVTLSDNADVIFSIGRPSDTNKFQLQRSRIVLN